MNSDLQTQSPQGMEGGVYALTHKRRLPDNTIFSMR